MLNESPDGILLVDEDGRAVGWNRAMLAATGFTTDVMAVATEESIAACFTPLDVPDLHAMDRGNASSTARSIVSAADGQVFIRTEERFGLSAAKTGRMICFRRLDVSTPASDEERKLRAVADQRRHALRMEAVGRLAGGIAHDFNNMLTVMLGFAEQLQDTVGSRAPLTEIVRAAHRAADLTRQLLAFSRRQVLHPRIVDVSAVVRSMGGMVGRLIGDDVELQIEAPDGLPRVSADPSQLEQVVMNLAINARDAMASGGRLSIAVRQVTIDAPRPGRAAQPPGEYVQVRVTDTGDGINPELLSRIFEPFFTTKGMHGTGLGLSTVYGIVKQSGGFIWVESEPGCGTTFTIDLPVTTIVETSHADSAAEAMPQPRRLERILLVEDLASVRLITKEMLEAEGYEVVTAATPREAIDAMEKVGDRIDVVLTDVMMPEMTGHDLAVVLRAARPDLPVLFMSGVPDSSDGAGSSDVLAKPFTRARLVAHVRARAGSR